MPALVRSLILAALAAVALTDPAPSLAADAPSPPEAAVVAEVLRVAVTWPVGEAAVPLPPAAFRVHDDGELRTLQAAPAAPGAPAGTNTRERIVLLFDLPTLSPQALRNAVVELSDLAPALTAAGAVEVLVLQASGLPAGSFAPSQDPQALQAFLGNLGLRQDAGDAVRKLRREWLGQVQARLPRPVRRDAAPRLASAAEQTWLLEVTGAAVAQEAGTLSAVRERLALWIGNAGAAGTVIAVVGAAEEDPRAFYRQQLAAFALEGDPLAPLPRPLVLPSADELGRTASVYGWTFLPFARRAASAFALGTAADSPWLRDQAAAPGLGTEPQGPSGPPMVSLRLPTKDEGPPPEPDLLAGLDPLPAWSAVAEATGSPVVTDPLQLAEQVRGLAARVRLEFRAPAVEPGVVRPLTLEISPTFFSGTPPTIGARRFRGAVPTELVGAVRVRAALDDRTAESEGLPVEAAFTLPPSGLGAGELVVTWGADEGDGLEAPVGVTPARNTRVTVGVEREGEPALVFHRMVRRTDAEAALVRMPVTLPAGTQSRVAVLVEDLDTGRWGSTLAAVIEDEGEEAALAEIAAPGFKAVELRPREELLVYGRTQFQALVHEPKVSRLEFLLDGKAAATRPAPPWTAVLDLGDLPRRRNVEVVAFDAAGSELGRDLLVVNEGSGSFRVRILTPRPTPASGPPLAGPVDVEAAVTAPDDAIIERVEFYWNTSRLATRYGPPYRQRVTIPPNEPGGFLRVVAFRSDGTSAEDVLFPNSTGGASRVDVELIELPVVVTDRSGRPVEGLTPEDFVVVEEGVRQDLTELGAATERSLSLALAVDSSASMFIKLPAVGAAAEQFVRGYLGPRDRALVVGFGGAAFLAQGTTGDISRLASAIDRLTPEGQTAIWEAVVFSLVQLQSIPGHKALVLYTDGADEDETFAYDTALRFARRVGIPVYFVLANNEIVRTDGKALGVRRFMNRVRRLAEAVGGRVYLTRAGEDLSSVYAEIGRELKSQYLLTYYPANTAEGWRRVKVQVKRPGLTVRTVAGYFR